MAENQVNKHDGIGIMTLYLTLTVIAVRYVLNWLISHTSPIPTYAHAVLDIASATVIIRLLLLEIRLFREIGNQDTDE